MKEESWGRIRKKESSRRNHGGIREKESWRSYLGGFWEHLGSILEASRHPLRGI